MRISKKATTIDVYKRQGVQGVFQQIAQNGAQVGLRHGKLPGQCQLLSLIHIFFWKFMCSYTILRNFVDG